MSLLQLAEADLMLGLEEVTNGFALAATLTNPAGTSATINGFSTDVSAALDVETGQIINNRTVSISFRISTIETAGLTVPTGVMAPNTTPWTVTFSGQVFKVTMSNPDRTLGLVQMYLEVYTP